MDVAGQGRLRPPLLYLLVAHGLACAGDQGKRLPYSDTEVIVYRVTIRNTVVIRTITENRMIHHHPHPSETLKAMVFDPASLSVTEAADRLAMSRVALSRVINGKAGISPDLAIRLEMAGVSTAVFWMGLQSNYDLWLARQREQPTVQSLLAAREG